MAKKKVPPGTNVNAKLVSDPKYAPFEGHYRKAVKTSVARTTAGRIAPTKAINNIGALLDSLKPDAQMRADHKLTTRSFKEKERDRKKGGVVGPQRRFPEEIMNVSVPCWICAVKYETGKTGDNDFHVILASAANTKLKSTRFMTSEVSGLPAGGPDLATLSNARQQLVDLFPAQKLGSTFYKPTAAIRARIQGSLHFDGDHPAGKVGPLTMRPRTVWEIHPVTKIAQR